MHDKYYYEAAEMALIDTKVERSFATGIAGFSHVVDSLSAIKYAKVKAIRDEDGITTDFQVEGDFPRYGNDDDRADEIATTLLSTFLEKLKHIHTYRDSSQPLLFLPLLLTLFMVKLPELFRMEERLESLWHLVQTHPTAQSRTDFLLP